MPLSHLNAWRAVDAVLSEGSVARAAGELGVTQAAVSAQIRRLEERLGRTLFRRPPEAWNRSRIWLAWPMRCAAGS
ncbi:helix-turn-helix domain-containing protein [Mameliella alba]|uniref:helix-turn-helix domain-containing protein n=1 Tax=Mameliella alba TaxID=561184 RepID=UPI00155424B0|nr:LysR family transcriptional regulator [Mameliella alba]